MADAVGYENGFYASWVAANEVGSDGFTEFHFNKGMKRARRRQGQICEYVHV